MNESPDREKDRPSTKSADWLEIVRAGVASLRFGVIQIVVHDSRVVQVETTQKLRIEPNPPKPS